jgi:threonyl-tRNA synthetase
VEIGEILAMVDEAYRALDIPSPRLRFSRAGAGPKYAVDDPAWERGEAMIRGALDTLGLDYLEAQGEAAFYGPKIDLQVTDPHGREQTLSTIQVDFHLPSRFDLIFRRADVPERPVIVHRSIVSTMERMVAHLIEVHNGALPVWLAPTQATVLPVDSEARAYAVRVRDALRQRALRAEIDERDATLAARVRDAGQRRIPYLAIVGARESATDHVSVRLRDGTQLPPMKLDAFGDLAREVANSRRPTLTDDGRR